MLPDWKNLTFTFKQERLNVTKLGHSTRTILIIIYKMCDMEQNLMVPVFLTRVFLTPFPLGKICCHLNLLDHGLDYWLYQAILLVNYFNLPPDTFWCSF